MMAEDDAEQSATGGAHSEKRMRRIDFFNSMLYALCPMPMDHH
jgi:hypothetical protein